MTFEPTASPLHEPEQTFNPWSVVNLVFNHLAAAGFEPTLGQAGDPSIPARELLIALGITPGQDHEGPGAMLIQNELARLRALAQLPETGP